ncbi:hypothetical protein Tco_1545517, partial [Tanacetum coccineum]
SGYDRFDRKDGIVSWSLCAGLLFRVIGFGSAVDGILIQDVIFSSNGSFSASLDCGYFVDGSGYYAFDDVAVGKHRIINAFFLFQPQGQEPKARQQIKLMSGLKKIVNLNLEKNKSDLLKDSVFGNLTKITNKKESSLLLLSPLYKSYDASKGVFEFNDEASFSFCTQEIANVIAMKDRGISLEEYEECLSSSPHFPQYLYHLRDQCVTGVEGKILATHIKPMLNGMSIGDDEGKLLFKKLMIYYLIEEVLLCEANSTRVPRAKTWHLVEDIERCESVNWPKAIDQHLRRALVGCQDWDKQGGVGEHSFEGAMPVLEVCSNRAQVVFLSTFII